MVKKRTGIFAALLIIMVGLSIVATSNAAQNATGNNSLVTNP